MSASALPPTPTDFSGLWVPLVTPFTPTHDGLAVEVHQRHMRGVELLHHLLQRQQAVGAQQSVAQIGEFAARLALLLCLKRGGRLVTCGATSGPSTTMNLMQLFQQQYRIFGSFGCSMRNIRESLAKMAEGLTPVIDTVFPLEEFHEGLERLESRRVFGKIIVTF